MVETLLTLFCLVVSFCFSSKKMKVLSYVQAVFSFVLFFLVFILSPLFTFIYQENNLFFTYIAVFKDILVNFQYNGFSIIKTLLFAIVFLTILSIFTIIEYCRNRVYKKESETKISPQRKKYSKVVYVESERKKYLRLSRLLN